MEVYKISQHKRTIIAVMLVVCIAILRLLMSNGVKILHESVLVFIEQLVYFTIVISWGMELKSRILDEQIKKYVFTTVILMCIWLVLKSCKDLFFDWSITAFRYINHLYFFPIIFISLMYFYIALELYIPGNKKIPKRPFFWLSLVVFILIFTNDFHNLAFIVSDKSNKYSIPNYGPVYYFSFVMTYSYLIIGTVLLVKNTKIEKRGISKYRPVFWVVILLTYYIFFRKTLGEVRYTFIDTPEFTCLIHISIIESCMRIGLIMSNKNYERCFKNLLAQAVIYDNSGKLIYKTSDIVSVNSTELETSKKGPVELDIDSILYAAEVKGGYIHWIEDRSEINRLNKNLLEFSETIADENELLTAENELKKQKAAIDEKNKIYDEIDEFTNKQREKIMEILENLDADSPDYESSMSLACVYNAYVKRRSNLALIAYNTREIKTEELGLCLRESGEYLVMHGIDFLVDFNIKKESLLSDVVCLFYDFFEKTIECALPKLCSAFVTVNIDDTGSVMRIALENPSELINADWKKDEIGTLAGKLDIYNDDETIYVTLEIKEVRYE